MRVFNLAMRETDGSISVLWGWTMPFTQLKELLQGVVGVEYSLRAVNSVITSTGNKAYFRTTLQLAGAVASPTFIFDANTLGWWLMRPVLFASGCTSETEKVKMVEGIEEVTQEIIKEFLEF